jgi:hypothetical protein
MKLQNLFNDVIGIRNPYGLIQKAGKKTRRGTKTRRKSRTKSRNKFAKKIHYTK